MSSWLAQNDTVEPGGNLPVALTMTETWMVPDRAPPPDMVTLERVSATDRAAIPLRPDAHALNAVVAAPSGPFVLSAKMRRDRMETPRMPDETPKPEGRITRSETFSKSFVNLTPEATI
jgi:hypothetical protein